MTNMEIEVKFQIYKPDFNILAELYGPLTKYHITQAYLISLNSQVERRVRRKANLSTGKVKYTYTVKRNILGREDTKVREETEKEISYTQYKNYIATSRDLNCAILDKERTVFEYEGNTIEIDEYSNDSNFTVLEIELFSENQSFSIPKEISLIKNLTGCKSYSNYSLARKFLQETVRSN